MIRHLLALTLVLAAACSSSQKKEDTTPPVDKTPPTAEEEGQVPDAELSPEADAAGMKMLAFMGQIADIFEMDKDDCDKMGTDLKAYAAAHKDEMAAMKAEGEKFSPEQKQAFMKKHEAEFQAVMEKMMGGAQKCADHQGVKDAMAEFQSM